MLQVLATTTTISEGLRSLGATIAAADLAAIEAIVKLGPVGQAVSIGFENGEILVAFEANASADFAGFTAAEAAVGYEVLVDKSVAPHLINVFSKEIKMSAQNNNASSTQADLEAAIAANKAAAAKAEAESAAAAKVIQDFLAMMGAAKTATESLAAQAAAAALANAAAIEQIKADASKAVEALGQSMKADAAAAAGAAATASQMVDAINAARMAAINAKPEAAWYNSSTAKVVGGAALTAAIVGGAYYGWKAFNA